MSQIAYRNKGDKEEDFFLDIRDIKQGKTIFEANKFRNELFEKCFKKYPSIDVNKLFKQTHPLWNLMQSGLNHICRTSDSISTIYRENKQYLNIYVENRRETVEDIKVEEPVHNPDFNLKPKQTNVISAIDNGLFKHKVFSNNAAKSNTSKDATQYATNTALQNTNKKKATGNSRPGLPGVESRLQAFFQYVGKQKTFLKPNLTDIARKILPAERTNTDIETTRRQISKIVSNWNKNTACVLYGISEDTAESLNNLIKAMHQIQRPDVAQDELRQIIFTSVRGLKLADFPTVLKLAKYISRDLQRFPKKKQFTPGTISSYIGAKIIRSWRKDKAATKFQITTDLVNKMDDFIRWWKLNKSARKSLTH